MKKCKWNPFINCMAKKGTRRTDKYCFVCMLNTVTFGLDITMNAVMNCKVPLGMSYDTAESVKMVIKCVGALKAMVRKQSINANEVIPLLEEAERELKKNPFVK